MIKKAYALVGMPGSGKSEALKIVKHLNIPIVVMGDIIRDELKKNGIKINSKTMGEYSLKIRKKFGKDIVAVKTYEKISNKYTNKIVIDGLRNYEEIEYFKTKIEDFYIIAVHASPKTRFERLKIRNREDDPARWEDFVERDKREISMGISELIVLADYMLINEGEIEKVWEQLEKIVLEK
ncbi:MAG: AAA family ATPase [Candidatus Helarchaeota archaeon]